MSQPIPDNSREFPIGQIRLSDNCRPDKQSAAIEMLAVGKSLKLIAQTLEIDPKTLYHWRQDPDFQAALSERRRDLWASANDRLRGLLDESIDVIERQLRDRYDRSRFRAAATLLRLAGLKGQVSNNE